MQPEPAIFVIDDDDAVRQSLEFLLKTAGYAVTGFESAKAFLEILPQLRSGCIITDVRMPEITGIDLLRRIKERGVDIPVIVITGHGDISLAVDAMKLAQSRPSPRTTSLVSVSSWMLVLPVSKRIIALGDTRAADASDSRLTP